VSVLFMLGWLWWGLLGLAGVLVGFWYLGGVLRPVDPCRRSRDRWLRQHFGEDGRRRWLETRRICDGLKASRCKGLDGLYARLGKPRRGPDGGCVGFVLLPDARAPWGGPALSCHMPWGFDWSRYDRHAKGGPYSGGGDTMRGEHMEPSGLDWLAAGFWDPVGRADDGVVVDPMEAVRRDVTGQIWREGYASWSCPFDADLAKELCDEGWERVRRTERETGRKSAWGLRGLGRPRMFARC
jgi:hypothetical protein